MLKVNLPQDTGNTSKQVDSDLVEVDADIKERILHPSSELDRLLVKIYHFAHEVQAPVIISVSSLQLAPASDTYRRCKV